MKRPIVSCLAVLLLPFVAPAHAAGPLRDFCPQRPGLDTPPCTIDAGHADIETGVADWTLDKAAGTRSDTFVFGDSLLRYGVTDSLEAQVEWQGLGYRRTRIGHLATSHRTGSGDVEIALKQNLHNPDGSGFSLAVVPFATLPVGSHGFGAGAWTAGLLVPVSYELPHGLQLAFTGEADAAADQDGHRRHFAWSATTGLAVPIDAALGATFEIQRQRDEDPAGASTSWLGDAVLAWKAKDNLQLDAGAVLGLNRNAPDVELYAGVSRRF